MSAVAQGPIPDPDLAQLLAELRADIFYSFNCHQIGQIVSFDADAQTASVQLSVLRMVPTGNPVQYVARAYPVLVQVPVFINTGGTGRLTFPIAAGDPCLVLFNDRDIDNWWTTGTTAGPNTPRAHDLSDGLAMVGFRNKANKLTGYNTTDLELRFAGGKIKLNDKIAINGSAMDLKTLLNDIVAALTALNSKTGPSAATQIATVTADVTALMQ